MRRTSALLQQSAIDNLSLAVELFNRPTPTARDQAVPLLIGVAFEKLLKAMLFERAGSITDEDGNTLSFLTCINQCHSKFSIITNEDQPTLLSIKHQRDSAAHAVSSMSEEFLWLHVQASVSLFDALLRKEFDSALTDFLPSRVMPVSAHPPNDFSQLIDNEVAEIGELLAKNRRRSALAGSRLRPLLNLDASVTGRTDPPTPTEVRRAERLIRHGKPWRTIFPGLGSLAITTGQTEGVREIRLRVVSGGQGSIPVRRARPDEEDEALLYRGVSTFEEFGIQLSSFGKRLGVGINEGYALIDYLKLKEDPQSYFIRKTKSGNVGFQGLSARALELARRALKDDAVDLAAITRDYLARVRGQRKKGS